MLVGRRLIPIAAVVAVLGASAGGAAFAAETRTGGSAASSDTKCVGPGVLAKKAETDFAAIAKQLGVSTEQLKNALVSTKQWLGSSGVKPTPEAFAQHVAGLLGKSEADVTKAFHSGGVLLKAQGAVKEIGKTPDGKIDQLVVRARGVIGEGKIPGKMADKCVGEKVSHPAPDFAKAAKDLGVSTDQLTSALVSTKQWLGTSGVTPSPDAFIQHLASVLGVSPDKVKQALADSGAMFGK